MADKQNDVNWADFISDSESDHSDQEQHQNIYKSNQSSSQYRNTNIRKPNRIQDEIKQQEDYIDKQEGPIVELYVYNME